MIRLAMLLLFLNNAHAAHFNGGTITWKPVDPYVNTSSVTIIIQQTYWWLYPDIKCAKNVPASTPGRSNQISTLLCTADCSTDGSYSLSPINSSTDCVQVSPTLGMMKSERVVNKTLTNGTHFYLSWVGNAWGPLGNPPKSGSQWSITTFIDLRMRPDGFINTPPVASVVSPQYIIVNTLTNISISVSDADAGDIVRCRWSKYITGYRRRRENSAELYKISPSFDQTNLTLEEKPISTRMKRAPSCTWCGTLCLHGCSCQCSACAGTTCTGATCIKLLTCGSQPTTIDTTATMKSTSSYPVRQAIDECGDVCYPNSLPTGTNISNCTISTIGLVADTWYAAAVQVEDFINESSTDAMSSVPIQFLIYVMPQPSCTKAPIFMPITRCFEVTVGVTLTFNISAMNQCNPNDYDMADIVLTKTTDGVNSSYMAIASNNDKLGYITIVWTPSIDEIGMQQLCAIAYATNQVESDEYCMTFNVTTILDVCRTTTTSTTSTTSTSTTSTSTTSTTATTTEDTRSKSGPSWGLIAGILASVLPLTLCTICCLYQLLWSPAARRRRVEEQSKENRLMHNHLLSRKRSSTQTTTDSGENNRIRRPSKNYQVYDISSETKPWMKNRTSVLVSIYNTDMISRQMNRSTSVSLGTSLEMNDVQARANTCATVIESKSSPLEIISDVENLDEPTVGSLNSWATSSDQTLITTNNSSNCEGLIAKYKIQEQNRARISEVNF